MADIFSKIFIFKIRRTFLHQVEPYPTIIFEIMIIFMYKIEFLSEYCTGVQSKLVLLLWYSAVHPPSPKSGHIKWCILKSFHPVLTNCFLFYLSCYALAQNKFWIISNCLKFWPGVPSVSSYIHHRWRDSGVWQC